MEEHNLNSDNTSDSGNTKKKYIPRDKKRDQELGILREPNGNFIKGTASGPGRTRIYTTERLQEIAQEYIDWLLIDDKNLNWYKFAQEKKISYNTWWEFFDENDENNAFLYAREVEKRVKELKFVENGLNNKWNTIMSIFALKNKHNWADKIEHTHNNRSVQIIIEQSPSKIPIQLDTSKIPELDVLPIPKQLPASKASKESSASEDSDALPF